MKLTRQKKKGSVVGLDIEAGSAAAAEVRVNGTAEVVAAAVEPLAPDAFSEGEVGDADALADGLKSLFAEHNLSKRVRLGIGNQRVVVRMMRLPAIEDRKELEAAVRFQAQEQIPMPLEDAVLEHQVVGGTAGEDGTTPQVDVVVVAARRDMVMSFLEPMRRAGLEPVGVDLSAFGMIRVLAGPDAGLPAVEDGRTSPAQPMQGDGDPQDAEQSQAGQGGVEPSGGEQPEGEVAPQLEPGDAAARPGGAVLYCSVGDVMNLAVARGHACLFTRVSAAGLEGIVSRLGTDRGLSAEHATQWLDHVGLTAPVEGIEGDPETVGAARRLLEEGVGGLVDELRLSLDYYAAQEGAVPVSRIVLAGRGTAVPGLVERMEAGLGLPIAVPNPPPLAAFDAGMAARLTIPYGLSLES